MTAERPAEPVLRWHAALAYALLGPPVRDLVEPGVPKPKMLIDDLGGVESVRARVVAARRSGPWPYQVPPTVSEGLGAAQYAAAWTAVLAVLGPLATTTPPMVADRALTADERRLQADRPPHHGC
jgi:hypothetical protein